MTVFIASSIYPLVELDDSDALVDQTRFSRRSTEEGCVGTAVHDTAKGKGTLGSIPGGFVLNVVNDVSITGKSL
jgi:hypothetical protein